MIKRSQLGVRLPDTEAIMKTRVAGETNGQTWNEAVSVEREGTTDFAWNSGEEPYTGEQ